MLLSLSLPLPSHDRTTNCYLLRVLPPSLVPNFGARDGLDILMEGREVHNRLDLSAIS